MGNSVSSQSGNYRGAGDRDAPRASRDENEVTPHLCPRDRVVRPGDELYPLDTEDMAEQYLGVQSSAVRIR